MVTAVEAPKPVHVFRLQQGCHVAPMEGWQRPKGEDGKPLMRDEVGNPILHPEVVYSHNKDNIIRTDKELDKIYGADKFLRVSGDPDLVDDRASMANLQLIQDAENLKSQLSEKDAKIKEMQEMLLAAGRTSNAPGLEGMTVKQIEALADEEGVDLTGCSTKADKIAAIEMARAS